MTNEEENFLPESNRSNPNEEEEDLNGTKEQDNLETSSNFDEDFQTVTVDGNISESEVTASFPSLNENIILNQSRNASLMQQGDLITTGPLLNENINLNQINGGGLILETQLLSELNISQIETELNLMENGKMEADLLKWSRFF